MDSELDKVVKVLRNFCILGDFRNAVRIKTGHINSTWCVAMYQAGVTVRYILQGINTLVFKSPENVMDNVLRVTNCIRSKLQSKGLRDVSRRVLTVIPTSDGKSYFCDGDGGCWRMFLFIEDAVTRESITSPSDARRLGQAFANFQSQLAHMPGSPLHETIPNFHDTPYRFRYEFEPAISADSHGRVSEVKKEIAFIRARSCEMGIVMSGLRRSDIPIRVTHNDTKLNNVMFDAQTGEALCVVDLDTVMPGSALFDFGDMVRTATCKAPEDELRLDSVEMQMLFFKELVRGYYEGAKVFLTKVEKELLARSGKLITLELAMRFLTDYLQGDHYFSVHRPGHNLDRCRAQIKLVESMERHEHQMIRFVRSL